MKIFFTGQVMKMKRNGMTLKEFEAKFNLNLNKIIKVINGHLYANTNSVKLYINKDIVLEDLNKYDNLYIIEYFDGYLLGKRFLSLGTSENIYPVNPFGIKLDGNWNSGYALDYHTIESTFNGLSWDTIRPPIAEELYRLKYWGEQYRVDNIAKHAAQFLGPYKNRFNGWGLDLIIPVPPSDTTRQFQPVYEIARAIGQLVGLPVDFNSLKKVKSTSQLKSIDNPEERREILKDAFSINFNALRGKNVLIFDDLYRSGETLKAVCEIVKNIGKANGVYVLTITKTRSKR